MHKHYYPLLSIVLILFVFSCQTTTVSQASFLTHDLKININVDKQEVMASDKGLVDVKQGLNLIYLAPNSKVSAFTINGKDVEYSVLDSASLAGENETLRAGILAFDPPQDALYLLFKANTSKGAEFNIDYVATFDADVSEVKFSNQNVGREVTGTVLEKGAYLSPGAFFYPRGNDALMDFKLSATIPADWESISDGNSLSSIETGSVKTQVWENPFKSDGLMFMAAPFHVRHAMAGDIQVFCYFFEEDTSLFDTYLPATVEYMKMYSDLIGPYPYKRFTVAENFFPTGYGMPAWTLLGQQVIRLPFIVMTSLGHEVLHNWWGNSIYVDYASGNWCEGLTVYGADYRYKAQRSPDAARDYRKDILKQYKSYVNKENEFPVREFVSRHNAESRTIGYNKTMMIFHMIQETIGEDAFYQAWRDIYAGHQGKQVSWEDWIDAFQKTSGADLSYIIPQWVDRVGAAKLSVELLETSTKAGKTQVKFRISQPEDQVYRLKIPVDFIGQSPQRVFAGLNASSAEYEFTLEGEFQAFELDPDYELFRHLYPQEIEPILAAIMGAPQKEFVFYREAEAEALNGFADAITEEDMTPRPSTDLISAGLEGNYALILLNPTSLPPWLQQHVKIQGDQIIIKGKPMPLKGQTFVLSAQEEEIAAKFLVLISEDLASLPRIGQLIPHYGKYSYLVFKGTRNIDKGQWPALTSPLRVTL